MARLVLEHGTTLKQRTVLATSTDRNLIREFWRRVLDECDAVITELEGGGDVVALAAERAERDRLRQLACMFIPLDEVL